MFAKVMRNRDDGTLIAIVAMTHTETWEMIDNEGKVLEFNADLEGLPPIKIVIFSEEDEETVNETLAKMFGDGITEKTKDH